MTTKVIVIDELTELRPTRDSSSMELCQRKSPKGTIENKVILSHSSMRKMTGHFTTNHKNVVEILAKTVFELQEDQSTEISDNSIDQIIEEAYEKAYEKANRPLTVDKLEICRAVYTATLSDGSYIQGQYSHAEGFWVGDSVYDWHGLIEQFGGPTE